MSQILHACHLYRSIRSVKLPPPSEAEAVADKLSTIRCDISVNLGKVLIGPIEILFIISDPSVLSLITQ